MRYPDPTGTPITAAVRVPEGYRAKARYALAHLLTALGYAPRFAETGADLAYGDSGGEALALPYAPDAADYFASGVAYDPARATWAEQDGARVPLLFGEDIVAAAFFWLSGWQEHTTRARDQHGRFAHAGSLQDRLGIGTLPAADAYRDRLAQHLRAAGLAPKRRTWGEARWVVCPTCDVDHLRSWRAGTVLREARRYVGTSAPKPERRARLRAAWQDARAPGDSLLTSLSHFTDAVTQRGGTATIFLKAGRTSIYDGPLYLTRRALRAHLRSWRAAGFEVGLHPSYHAHAHGPRLAGERARLQKTWGAPVTTIRQHYLRDAPEATPRTQHAAGFALDATLGWPDALGFRHGTTLPFLRYDCARDAPHDLWEMPLAVMDGTLFVRLGLDAEAACEAVRGLTAQARAYGGAAVLLWHNHAWDALDHDGWHLPLLAGMDAAGGRLVSLDAALRGWLAG